MVDDARYRTKVWLDTYLLAANLTDDDGDEVKYITVFGEPDYPVSKVFTYPKYIDLIFSASDPVSSVVFNADKTVDYYEENVPITISCVDKPSITATKLKWKGEAELRRIIEVQGVSLNLRIMDSKRDITQRLGPVILYQTEVMLIYRRDTT